MDRDVRAAHAAAETAADPPVGRAGNASAAARIALFAAALGPGVIGLCADNDAGGMLSYLVTGAAHDLSVTLPALVLLALPTLWVQWVALRVAEASRLPYSKAVIAALGAPVARLEAAVLYGLNGVILATEFVGMALALSLVGMPRPLAVAITFGLVVALTGSRTYPRIEQILLRTAVASLAFIPALLWVHHPAAALGDALSRRGPGLWFLVLALAGNTMAPWMIYWQQNAVWAGPSRSGRQRLWDLATGVAALVLLAGAVLVLGALLPGRLSVAASPVRFVFRHGGAPSGILFALGLFDAGLVAACTVSLASLWTLREAVGRGSAVHGESPARGRWRAVHVATLAAAAAFGLWPGLSSASLALWAQALGAVWMPVSLLILGWVAGSRRVMGGAALGPAWRLSLWAMGAGYLVVAWLGLGI